MAYRKASRYAAAKYPSVVRGAAKRYKVYTPAIRQLASDITYLKGLVNSEPKIFGVTSSNNFGYNGVVVSLCDVPTGDTNGNRDGNRILPRYFNIKFHVNRLITSPTNSHTTVRYIVFRWWGESANAVGVAPAVTDILTTTGSQFAPLSQLSTAITGSKGDRNRRIEVHRSGIVTLDSVSKTSMDEDINITLNGSDKAPKEHIEYYDSTTNPPTSGGFFILFINDNAVTTDVAYYLSSRLTYYDN